MGYWSYQRYRHNFDKIRGGANLEEFAKAIQSDIDALRCEAEREIVDATYQNIEAVGATPKAYAYLQRLEECVAKCQKD